MLIDANGKIFGKINVIDLLALLLIGALGVYLATHFLLPRTGRTKMELRFFTKETEGWIAERVEKGDLLFDSADEIALGAVAKAVATAAESEEPDAVSLTVLADVMGEKHENGVKIQGKNYAVGDTVFLYIGDASLPMRLRDIRIEEGA